MLGPLKEDGMCWYGMKFKKNVVFTKLNPYLPRDIIILAKNFPKRHRSPTHGRTSIDQFSSFPRLWDIINHFPASSISTIILDYHHDPSRWIRMKNLALISLQASTRSRGRSKSQYRQERPSRWWFSTVFLHAVGWSIGKGHYRRLWILTRRWSRHHGRQMGFHPKSSILSHMTVFLRSLYVRLTCLLDIMRARIDR